MAPNLPESPARNSESYGPRQRIGLVLGLILFAAILLMPSPDGMSQPAQRTAAVAALMAVWWISEATHIAITALLPIPLFPLLAIMPSREVTLHYANHIVFLFLGGFIIALAMEKWNLHRRIALETIRRFGGRPAALLLGFMVATAFLSMWISNTATTMMMLPIAMAVVIQLAGFARIDGEQTDQTPEQVKTNFGLILLLGIAYSASIGGIGTVIGSPATVAFLGFTQQSFPAQPPIAFLDWSLMCVPIVIVFLPICWFYLCRFGAPIALKRIVFAGSETVIEDERRRLGPMTAQEKTVLVVALVTALLWIFRKPLELGDLALPGWSGAFSTPLGLNDATVAMSMAALLCLLPVNLKGGLDWKGRREHFIMDWGTIQRGLPWGIVMLFGGGFSLAAAVQKTGLATWLGSHLSQLEGTPVWMLVLLCCFLVTFLTEMTSNVATILMIAPVIGATAVEIGVHPYLLLIPAGVTASFAFVLPVATPPNAIVFSSGWVTIPRMARAGLALDLLGLLVVPVIVYFLGGRIFGFAG